PTAEQLANAAVAGHIEVFEILIKHHTLKQNQQHIIDYTSSYSSAACTGNLQLFLLLHPHVRNPIDPKVLQVVDLYRQKEAHICPRQQQDYERIYKVLSSCTTNKCQVEKPSDNIITN